MAGPDPPRRSCRGLGVSRRVPGVVGRWPEAMRGPQLSPPISTFLTKPHRRPTPRAAEGRALGPPGAGIPVAPRPGDGITGWQAGPGETSRTRHSQQSGR